MSFLALRDANTIGSVRRVLAPGSRACIEKLMIHIPRGRLPPFVLLKDLWFAKLQKYFYCLLCVN